MNNITQEYTLTSNRSIISISYKKIANDDAERWSITCTQCEDMAYEDNKLYFYLLHKANRDHTSYKSILFKHTKKGEAT